MMALEEGGEGGSTDAWERGETHERGRHAGGNEGRVTAFAHLAAARALLALGRTVEAQGHLSKVKEPRCCSRDPQSLNLIPETPILKPKTRNPRASCLICGTGALSCNPCSRASNPQTQTLPPFHPNPNPKPQTPNPKQVAAPSSESVSSSVSAAMQMLDLMAAARSAIDTVSNVAHLIGRAKAFLDLCPPIPGLVVSDRSSPTADAGGVEGDGEDEADEGDKAELRRNAKEFAEHAMSLAERAQLLAPSSPDPTVIKVEGLLITGQVSARGFDWVDVCVGGSGRVLAVFWMAS
jgi:hypothetical protein